MTRCGRGLDRPRPRRRRLGLRAAVGVARLQSLLGQGGGERRRQAGRDRTDLDPARQPTAIHPRPARQPRGALAVAAIAFGATAMVATRAEPPRHERLVRAQALRIGCKAKPMGGENSIRVVDAHRECCRASVVTHLPQTARRLGGGFSSLGPPGVGGANRVLRGSLFSLRVLVRGEFVLVDQPRPNRERERKGRAIRRPTLGFSA
jgi:hypothetical protein